MKSIENNFDNPSVNTLLHYHFYQLRSNSPQGSTHVLDIEGLKVPSIKFWSIWEEDKLIGCASIILVGPGKYSADYLINEIFINKSNPIDNTLLNNNRVKTDTNNRKNTAKTSRSLEKSNDDKQVKIFEFPFSSFLSS